MIESPPYNAETVYGTIIVMLFLFGGLWYLLRRPEIAASLELGFRSWLTSAKEATKADWARTKELIRVKTEEENEDACEKCPQFGTCSVNRCPLHPRYASLEVAYPEKDAEGNDIPFTGDPETRCRALRKTRERIAADYPGLKNGGLLDAEIARDRRRKARQKVWEALPEEEKARRIAKLAEMRAKRALESTTEGEE